MSRPQVKLTEEYISPELLAKVKNIAIEHYTKGNADFDKELLDDYVNSEFPNDFALAQCIQFVDGMPKEKVSDNFLKKFFYERGFKDYFRKNFVNGSYIAGVYDPVEKFKSGIAAKSLFKPEISVSAPKKKDYQQYQQLMNDQLDRAESIILNTPEFLGEDGVTALTFGCYLDSSIRQPAVLFMADVDDPTNGKAGKSQQEIGENTFMSYLAEDFLNPKRAKDWGLAAISGDAREKSSQVISALAAGDPKPAVEALERAYRTSIAYCINKSSSSDLLTEYGGIALLSLDALNKPELKQYSTLTDKEKTLINQVKTNIAQTNKLNQAKEKCYEEFLTTVAADSKTVNDSPEYSKAVENYLRAHIVSKYMGQIKTALSDPNRKDIRELTPLEELYIADPKAVEEALIPVIKQSDIYKAELSKAVDKDQLDNLDLVYSSLKLPYNDNLEGKLLSDLDLTFKNRALHTDEWPDTIKASVKEGAISKAISKPLQDAVKDLDKYKTDIKKGKTALDMDVFKEKIAKVNAAAGAAVNEAADKNPDANIQPVEAIESATGKVLKAIENNAAADKLTAKVAENAQLMHEKNVVKSTLKENIEYNQYRLEKVIDGLNTRVHSMEKAGKDYVEISKVKSEYAKAMAESVAGMLANKTMEMMLSKSHGHMNAEDMENLVDADLLKKSAKDIMKSDAFKSMMQELSPADIKKLATVTTMHSDSSEDKVTEDIKYPADEVIDSLYDKLIHHMQPKAPSAQAAEPQIQGSAIEENQAPELKNEEANVVKNPVNVLS